MTKTTNSRYEIHQAVDCAMKKLIEKRLGAKGLEGYDHASLDGIELDLRESIYKSFYPDVSLDAANCAEAHAKAEELQAKRDSELCGSLKAKNYTDEQISEILADAPRYSSHIVLWNEERTECYRVFPAELV
jgi:hypothetical protein